MRCSGKPGERKKKYLKEKTIRKKQLESFDRVSELADFALDKAEEMGLTQREVEELPERIKALLKWDICWDDRKYVRHPRPVETRTRCIKNLW